MLTWHDAEPVAISALQVLNGIFSVPQMSVHLRLLTVAQQNMIQFYTNYWIQHKSVILDGVFRAYDPLANYPVLSAEKEGHLIVGLYSDANVMVKAQHTIDILNAKVSEEVVVLTQQTDAMYDVTIWNCEGEQVAQSPGKVMQACNLFSVPAAGMMRVKKVATV